MNWSTETLWILFMNSVEISENGISKANAAKKS